MEELMNEDEAKTHHSVCAVCEGIGVVSPLMGLSGDGACPACDGTGIAPPAAPIDNESV